VDDSPQEVRLDGLEYALTIEFPSGPPRAPGANPGAEAPDAGPVVPRGGIIIALGADEFLVAGTGMVVTFTPLGPGAPIAGILSVREGRLVDGKWEGGRWMNGDQTHQGRHIRLGSPGFSIQRVRLYRYR
jgi:hypothetical protein